MTHQIDATDATFGPTASTAEKFLSRKPQLLKQYRLRLEQIKSPLVTDEGAWKGCALQAERIITDCADSLLHDKAQVRGSLIQQVQGLGMERATQGIYGVHSIRAGVILFELAFDALAEVVTDSPGDLGRFGAAVRSLQMGIGERLEAGALGHDIYLLNTVREVNAAGHRQLAREIHDHLGNNVSLALRQLELYEIARDKRPEHTEARIAAVKATLTESLGIIRDLVGQLRRSESEGTLQGAFTAFLESMAITRPEVRVQVNGSEEWAPQQVLDEIFLVVRECLRNALAHADAQQVLAVVDIAPFGVHALIEDDGCGFDLAAVGDAGLANGITSATERVELLGGTILISSNPRAGGTRVTVSIPLSEHSGDTESGS